MAWTAVKTWASGDILTASDMNAQVSNNSDFLMNTAFKKVLSVSGSFASLVTTSGTTELTITTLAVADPTFPSTSYSYVAYGTFIGNPSVSGDDFTFLIRDNGTAGTVVARGWQRSAGVNSRFSSSLVAQPVTVASGARTVYYRVVRAGGTGTVDVNYSSNTTFQGALLAPI